MDPKEEREKKKKDRKAQGQRRVERGVSEECLHEAQEKAGHMAIIMS